MKPNKAAALSLDFDEIGLSVEEMKVFSVQAPYISDYRLLHLLNGSGWDFSHTGHCYTPFDFPLRKFDIYLYTDEVSHLQWFFIGKRENIPAFIDSLPQANYFLMATGPGLDTLDTEAVVQQLSRTENVFWVEELDLDSMTAAARKLNLFGCFSQLYYFLSDKDLIL